MAVEEEVEAVQAAYTKGDCKKLQTYRNSLFIRVQIMATCRLYILQQVAIDTVINMLKQMKDDDSLTLIISHHIDKWDITSSQLRHLLQFQLYDEFLVCLELMIRCIESSVLSTEDGLRLLGPLQAHLQMCQSPENSSESFLCKYIMFTLSPQSKTVEFVKKALQNRPLIPHIDQLRRLYTYLAQNGVAIEEFGYEADLFESPVIVVKPVDMMAREMITLKASVGDIISKCGLVGVLELLQSGQVIDFAPMR